MTSSDYLWLIVGFVIGGGVAGVLTQSKCQSCEKRLEAEQLDALKRRVDELNPKPTKKP